VQNEMSIEDKLAQGCRCMGVNMLKQESCNHPGLGEFRIPAVDQPLPQEPPPLPPEPVRPVEPANQSDNVAMAEFFAKLQAYEAEVNAYKLQVEQYQKDRVAYETQRAELQVAVAPAEGVVRNFYGAIPWAYVDKEDTVAYYSKLGFAWIVQSGICLILFGAILYLQKRKDVV